MSELPYMPVAVNDEIAETSHLTNEELGALVRLKWAMWKTGGYLPHDGKTLARIARAGKRWGAIAPAVMAQLTAEGGKVSSPTLLATLLITRERRSRKARSGGHATQTSDDRLNTNNPLKTNKAGGSFAPLNHNHNYKGSSSTRRESERDGSAAPRKGAAGQPSEADAGSVEACRNDRLQVLGTELLTELLTVRANIRSIAAEAQVKRWLQRVDPETLAQLLAAAEQENLRGQNFTRVVEQRITAIQAEAMFGRSFRFPLHGLKGGASGDG